MSSLSLGIVGLPNVGKSTLFNALVKNGQAAASNYPFCTIDPNVGIVEVPDNRLSALSAIVTPERIVPAIVEFFDIAGIIKGASQGEGLGNKFLAHIRETSAILLVARFFDHPDIIHVNGEVNPKSDLEIVILELILADVETVSKARDRYAKLARGNDADAKLSLEILNGLAETLNNQKLASSYLKTQDSPIAKIVARDLQLLTSKRMLVVANISEDMLSTQPQDLFTKYSLSDIVPNADWIIPICAKLESDLVALPEEDQAMFLEEYGLKESGLIRLVQSAYSLLNLETYFTAGVKEVRAWTMPQHCKAPQAAGIIHTDFEKGFIRAEVISYEDYALYKGEQGARDAGKLKSEGKEYTMKDGDVVHFRFNV